ncbi:MAG: hypothetical protein ACR2OX_12335, partial [Methyloligellaceae bacterium]
MPPKTSGKTSSLPIDSVFMCLHLRKLRIIHNLQRIIPSEKPEILWKAFSYMRCPLPLLPS